jgi:hypothetical protein
LFSIYPWYAVFKTDLTHGGWRHDQLHIEIVETYFIISFQKKMAEIDVKINAQGDKIRELKAAKSAKDVIDPAVKNLLALKAEFKVCKGELSC